MADEKYLIEVREIQPKVLIEMELLVVKVVKLSLIRTLQENELNTTFEIMKKITINRLIA